jgi:ATP phosphoribosyltransferase
MLQGSADLMIAIPSKGRLMEQSVDLLRKSGLKFSIIGRKLFSLCKETGAMVIFVNAQDIPALVSEGVVDLGITGSDIVYEKGVSVIEHRRLGFGRCRLSFASHKDSAVRSAADFSGRTLGTKFITSAKNYFEEHSISDVRILEINGAVEVMVLLGLVDGILDVVESGSSLREHELAEREIILEAEAVLIGNSTPRNVHLCETLLRRVEGVVLAAHWSMLEYNCPSTLVDKAKEITTGYSAPTIQKTDSEAWVAIKVMVEKDKVQVCTDRLEALGCSAIIATEVVYCRL